MNPGTTRRMVAAAKETVVAPQWATLVLCLLAGWLAQAGPQWVLALVGLLLALFLGGAAMRSLGITGAGSLLDLLNPFGGTPGTRNTLASVFFLAAALTIIWATSNALSAARWVVEVVPPWFAPQPDVDYLIVLLVLFASTTFAVATLVLKRKRHLLIEEAPAARNRETLRQEMKKPADRQAFKEARAQARHSMAYWIDAVVTLVCALIAILPSAFGWGISSSILLGVLLPLLVISVRFRGSEA